MGIHLTIGKYDRKQATKLHNNTQKSQMIRKWLGNILLGIGVALLLGTVGLYGYAAYEEARVAEALAVAEQLDGATATAEALLAVVETATARGLATAAARADATETAQATPPPTAAPGMTVIVPTTTPRPRPTATATPLPLVLRRVIAPKIELDAPVVTAKIVNGEWEVPKFVAGHLEGTGLPGVAGNVVLSGHVQSISSGNVFARIDALAIGDDVVLRTNRGELVYRISGKSIVTPDDVSVVRSGEREELTLITCTGSFNPLTGDYSHRWVVWGDRVS